MSEFEDYMALHKRLVARRDPWMPYYQQLADVLLPNQADFTGRRLPGEQRGTGIYDGTPRLALRDLANAIDGMIKPKSSTWFDLEMQDPGLMQSESVRLWLDIVKDYMWSAIYQKDARFIQRSGEVDHALACFGWGVLWIQERKDKNGLLFRSFHNSQVAIDENEEGVIDTLSISEKLTPRQAAAIYQKLKLEVPSKIADAVKSKIVSDQRFEFVQIVSPNDERDSGAALGIKAMPFKSCLIDVSCEKVLDHSGYYEFPAAIPRWETSPGEVYARSPGMLALPDANTLQAMGKTLLVGAQRAVDPPIWVANDAVVSPLRTFPGGVTTLDITDQKTPVGNWPVSNNLPVGREMQNDYRRQVEAAFFKNIFNLPIETRVMTATEIMARKEEFIRVVGPVFGRLETDYVGHIVERVFGIMDRAGVLPPRPPELVGVKPTFRFKSPIQQARKQMEIAALSQALNFIAPLAANQPEILDYINGEAIVADAPEWGGMPNRWMNTKKTVEQMRSGRAEAQQQAQISEQAGPMSEAMKNIASAQSMLAPT